jgi:superfamily II DNA or RNA helicase
MLQETLSLFKPVTRDERQEECIQHWKEAKGHGTIVGATGFGKTRVAIKIITRLVEKNPTIRVLIAVPTELLKNQWIEELDVRGLGLNCEVVVMMGASKRLAQCDLLVLDEAHRANATQLSQILINTKFKLILGLTATFERLDGRHEILAKYAPVCDTVTMQDALLNGWVSKYSDYVVLLDVPDIDVYKEYNKEFIQHFEFFGFDFGLVMSMAGKNGYKNRLAYRDQICKDQSKKTEVFKEITYHATAFMRALQKRKAFVANHPDKLRVAEEIIKHRSNSKIITFSSNVKMAESFQEGFVYTGKEGKKKNRITLEEFSKMNSGVLHTVKLAEEGMSINDLSVGIMLGVNSSKTKSIQTLGRVVRLEKDKHAEFFTIVINDTVETEWMKKSKNDNNFVVIDEENLLKVLKGEPYESYKRKLKNYQYRF